MDGYLLLGGHVSTAKIQFWQGKKVLITGHTGFVGSWLTLLLKSMGAEVAGFSLGKLEGLNLFSELEGAVRCEDHWGDIRVRQDVFRVVDGFRPEIVVHLAAQSQVQRGWVSARETVETNILGTFNVLQAALNCSSVHAILNMTSDKVYSPSNVKIEFTEDCARGGQDFYSVSKASADMLAGVFLNQALEKNKGLASIRAGNILGGGDFLRGRLVPDYFFALKEQKALQVRNLEAVRPWQHVLDAIDGMTTLIQKMFEQPKEYSGSYNLGPSRQKGSALGEGQRVRDVLKALSEKLGPVELGGALSSGTDLKENPFLQIDCTHFARKTSWAARWESVQYIEQTAWWYKEFLAGRSALDLCKEQLNNYFQI